MTPPEILQPQASELGALVRALHAEGRPWLPAGQASRLGWGAAVSSACTVVRSSALNRILEHNPGDFTIRVEAGTPLDAVQQALAEHGQWLAVDQPWGSGALGGGSIGGLVARGLTGGYRQRYLGIRDQLIGIGLMRADGVSAKAGGQVVKNVAGYDLMRLFCGSWGSLGLITEVTLRSMPLPPQRSGLLVQGPLSQLAPLGEWLLGSSLTPERIDWWSPALAAAAGLAPQPLLLLGLASVDALNLAEQQTAIAAQTALACEVLTPERLGELLAVAGGGEAPAPAWLLRLGVDPARVPLLLAAPEWQGVPLEIGAGSGLGVAWAGGPGDSFHAAQGTLNPDQVANLRRRCLALGGHLTVLSQPEGDRLTAWEDAPSRPLIERIKDQFDRLGQLAPGRLPGVARAAGHPPRPHAREPGPGPRPGSQD
jgi:glycolate oxidase FAD binding subunit